MAVVIAFFICWAPFHTQRITAFVTRLLDKANKSITSDVGTKLQEILFFTSGKESSRMNKKSIHSFLLLGVLYYLSATVNPLLYNIMSKRYRNSFKRTLCRSRRLTPKTSYPNGRSNAYYNPYTPRSAPSPYTTNPYHRQVPPSPIYNHYRDNVFTFSMSKYKLVIGSRTCTHQNNNVNSRRRTSFHYRLSFLQQNEREEEKEQMKLQVQQRKFSLSVIQQPRTHRARFIFTTNLPPLTPPNSSISDSKNFTQLPIRQF